MRKNITIIVSCLWFVTSPLFAEPSMESLRWSIGKFEIPIEIQQITDANGLRPFLHDSNTLLRISAIRRLGEIEGSNAISTLLDVFEKEPSVRGIDRVVIVRNEIVRTLGRMDSDKAKTALLDILDKFWRAGSQVPEAEKRYWYEDVDFASLVPESLKQLEKWSDDTKVYEIAKNIAVSEKTRSLYAGSRIEKNAWVLYMKGDIQKQGIKSEKDSAKYLLDLIKNIEEEGITHSEFRAVKREAAKTIFEQHSKEVLASLQKELEEDIAKVPYNEPNGSLSNSHYKLSSQISYIERILREKGNEKNEPNQ